MVVTGTVEVVRMVEVVFTVVVLVLVITVILRKAGTLEEFPLSVEIALALSAVDNTMMMPMPSTPRIRVKLFPVFRDLTDKLSVRTIPVLHLTLQS